MEGKFARPLTFVILAALCFANFSLGIKLNYPPYENELATLISARLAFPKVQLDKETRQTVLNNILGEEQYLNERLFLLRSKLQIFAGTKNVFNLRAINFFLLIAALAVFYYFLKQIGWKPETALVSLIIILISPLFLSLWLFRPKICLFIFLVVMWLYFWSKKDTNYLNISFLATTLLLLFYSSLQGLVISLLIFVPLTILKFYQAKKYFPLLILAALVILLIIPIIKNPAFKNSLIQTAPYDAVKPNQIAKQIGERITREDGLQVKVSFPLWFRRIGYNKIFFAYRNVVQEVLDFFDLETLFFQEVHPTHQKSEVVFFWPEIFLFLLGTLGLIKTRFGKKQKILLMLIFLSILFYLLTPNDSVAGKHSLTLFVLAVVVGKGFEEMPKGLSLVILLLLVWAICINTYDVLKRPLFWYDNRPYVYSEGMRVLKEKSPEFTSGKNIYLTTLIGNPKVYYFYFFSADPKIFLQNQTTVQDNDKVIHFESFNLLNNPPQKNSLYFGFLGEFIGPNPLNEFLKQDINKIEPMGLKIEKVWKLDNTIAFRYGDYFILASTKD